MRAIASCALLWVAACSGSGPDFLVGGIQVREPDMEHWLDTLHDVGLNTVSVTVYARQGRWDSADLASDAREDWVAPELRAARKRGLSTVLILRVALEHALEENLFLWHGMIMPRDDETLDRWFDAYFDYVAPWARLAEAEGVDVLGIGSELNALASTVPVEELPVLEEYYLNLEKQAREHEKVLAHEGSIDSAHLKAGWGKTYASLPDFLDHQSAAHRRWAQQVTFGADVEAINARRLRLTQAWRRLIERIRKLYSGQLTYAANFDQYRMVAFWDELDLLGINAYFPLRTTVGRDDDPGGLYPLFESSWSRILGEIDHFRAERGLADRQVLFTELGYTFRQESTLNPWAGDGFGMVAAAGTDARSELVVWREQAVDYEERALAVRALRTASRRYPPPGLLRGILYWKLSTVAEHEKIEPFVLVLRPLEAPGVDPLQRELVEFLAPGEE